jgi:hypothetical protein
VIVLRRNPETGWWHWRCSCCDSWSLWQVHADAVWHADLHGRRLCRTTT